ncbi:MAG: hypothetical protein GY760_14735, partial [Deltaproteobacteria bacterium]|nr:hypothetical protein [Deltaproteobacteria bacterium]
MLSLMVSIVFILLSENDIEYYWNFFTPDKSIEFKQKMEIVDRMIIGEGYNVAAENLKKATSSAQSSINWLSLIKRAYILSEKTRESSYYSEYSKKAFKRFPGNEEIRAMYVYSHLRDKSYIEAGDVASVLKDSRYNNLKVEAALGAEFSSDLIADPFSYLLKLLSESEDPELFKKIAKITGNSKLLFNAAVLHMKTGEIREAYNIAFRLSGDWLNDEAIGMISIDAEEYNQALTRFLNHNQVDKNFHNEKWAIQLIIADLYQILGSKRESGEFYQRSIEINPQGVWNQYANYSRLLKQEGRYKQSMDLMKKGIDLFTENRKELVIAMVNNQFDKNRSTTERYLKSFL